MCIRDRVYTLLLGNREVCEELLAAGANTEVADVDGLTRMINYSNGSDNSRQHYTEALIVRSVLSSVSLDTNYL